MEDGCGEERIFTTYRAHRLLAAEFPRENHLKTATNKFVKCKKNFKYGTN